MINIYIERAYHVPTATTETCSRVLKKTFWTSIQKDYISYNAKNVILSLDSNINIRVQKTKDFEIFTGRKCEKNDIQGDSALKKSAYQCRVYIQLIFKHKGYV